MKRFSDWFRSSPAPIRYVLICTALALAYYALQKFNHRDGMADFRVYYDATQAWLSGDSPYGKAFGVSSGYYKYSPAALIPFSVLVWLPYPFASAIYFAVVLAAFLILSLLLVRFMEQELGFSSQRRGWLLALSALFLADHFERELHLGNVNLFLLIAALALYVCWRNGRARSAGVILASILLVKPHFAILVPYFFWKKEFRTLAWMAAGVLAGLLLPALTEGWSGNIALHREWLAAMQHHNMRLSLSPHTLYGILNDWVLAPLGQQGGRSLVIAALASCAIGFFALLLLNRHRKEDPASCFLEFFLLIGLIPNLTHTDTEHFMWSWPLVTYSMAWLLTDAFPWRRLTIAVLLLAFIPYTLNSPDLVGRRMSWLVDEGGLLGMANVLLLALAVALYLRQPHRHATSAANRAS